MAHSWGFFKRWFYMYCKWGQEAAMVFPLPLCVAPPVLLPSSHETVWDTISHWQSCGPLGSLVLWASRIEAPEQFPECHWSGTIYWFPIKTCKVEEGDHIKGWATDDATAAAAAEFKVCGIYLFIHLYFQICPCSNILSIWSGNISSQTECFVWGELWSVRKPILPSGV